MRTLSCLFLLLATACGRSEPQQPAPVVPAALAYDGADATDSAARIAHGERLSRVLGCTSCHGQDLRGGNVTPGESAMGDMYAPNLTLLMASYSDRQLSDAVRHGRPLDGRKMVFMPSEMYAPLADPDMAALTAYLRTLKPGGKAQPPVRPGPLFAEWRKTGEYTDAADMAVKYRDHGPADMGPRHALGRHIARTNCIECHNIELQGYEGETPNLDIAGAFTEAELERLLTVGEGKSKKELPMMSGVARDRYAHLTPHERGALIAYLKARANRPQ